MKQINRWALKILLFVIIIFIQFVVNAQNSVSISPFNSIEMAFAPPAGPGSPILFIKDESKWLNYNITLDPYDPYVSISVEIASGTIPQGLQLQIQAGIYQGSGGGAPGTPTGKITLSNMPQMLIANIGTCNTGSGLNVGHQLTYSMNISDYSALQVSFSSLELLFTITQTAMRSVRDNVRHETHILKKVQVFQHMTDKE